MSTLFVVIAFIGFIGVIYPTPWHRKLKFLNTRWKNVGLFIIACIVIGVLAPETTETPKKTVVADTKTETKKEQPKKEAPAVEKVYKIGDTVDVSNRVFKVNSIKELDAVKDPMGTKYPAGEGARFIQLNVTVKNQKKEQVTIMSDEVKLLAKNGTEYSTDAGNEVWVNQPGQSFFLETLNPGISKTANILFAVPKDIKLADLKVKVTDGGLVEDVIKYIGLK